MRYSAVYLALSFARLAYCFYFQHPLVVRQPDDSVVDLGYARYKGTHNSTTNVTSILGIRYAAAPVGNLRWQAPQSPGNMTGVISADTEPASCYQTPGFFGVAPTNRFRLSSTSSLALSSQFRHDSAVFQDATESANFSEDCLFLNVHVPGQVSSNPKRSYPVVVWIHGGGYVNQAASMYDGSQLVLGADHEVIAVVIQYRLGLFGFLAGSEVKAGGALNAGLLDQQFALRWVQSHISSFGGDPGRVTIWGESAGGGSVLQHIIANDGQTTPPLFKYAITSSAFVPSQYKYNHPIPEAVYAEVLAHTDCDQAPDTLACLRSLDVYTLSNANDAIHLAGFYGSHTFVPVVDGDFISQPLTSAFTSGKVNGDLLLSLFNEDEGSIFINTTSALTPTQYVMDLFPNVTESQANEVAEIYVQRGGSSLDQIQAINGEAILTCPSYYAQAAFSGRSWMGEFVVPPAIHTQDIPYYFTGFSVPGFFIPPIVNNTSFKTSFVKSFLDFAISQDPNSHSASKSDVKPHWPMYSEGDRTEMIFNVTTLDEADIRLRSTDSGLLARCNLWRSLSSYIFINEHVKPYI